MDTIPIFFTIDESFVPMFAVALKSLIMNADKNRSYKIIVIGQDLSEKSKGNLAAMVDAPFEIEFLQMEKTLENITERDENLLRCNFFSLTIYYRLFIPDMFPQYDKAIYLDSDIVVPGDISKMYDIDLGSNYVGACADKAVASIEPFSLYVENALGVDRHKYINSGVLLMNMDILRGKHMADHFVDLLDTYHFNNVAPDQDYLNSMCCGNILFMDNKWDVMPANEGNEEADPWLIHYNLFDKPWYGGGVMYEEYFWKYAKETDYYQWLRDYTDNYTDEQKQANVDGINHMLEKASRIPSEDVTFKKLSDSGVKIRL